MTTAADELRTAATRLRERATTAERGLSAALMGGTHDLFGKAIPDPAAMHPAVGRALAELLDDQADGDDEGVINPWALAVAQQILGNRNRSST